TPLSSSILSLLTPSPLISTLFPYTTLFRSNQQFLGTIHTHPDGGSLHTSSNSPSPHDLVDALANEELVSGIVHQFVYKKTSGQRSEEHTSELQSRVDIVCRLLLEKKKI